MSSITSKIEIARAAVALAASCDRATFGRAQEDVLDESYRKPGKLDPRRFASTFNLHATRILPTTIPYLIKGKYAERGVETELYKLNPIVTFFRAHKDTRSEHMFGSLVVLFPSPHTGDELILRHAESTFTFDSGTVLADSPVRPNLQHHRVTLTYNLYYPSPASSHLSPNMDSISSLKTALSSLLEDPDVLPDGGLFGFSLSHSYPVTQGETVLFQCSKATTG
ncbi:hypothetical protein L218DRAFT_975585 [Marasmius fiardii PR-910]|nr:hypothetical protein L218DRAFT_975585 [Marasmius fiardii PR-910]